MEFKGSKTEHNLLASFAGESQARNRYTFFASQARKEGYEQIADIFRETAGNEKEHAELFFKHLQGGNAQITAEYPAGVIGKTFDNRIMLLHTTRFNLLNSELGGTTWNVVLQDQGRRREPARGAR